MENRITNKRIYLFDNIKFFLITTVVVGHFAEVGTSKSEIYKSIFVFIYAFHMPLFLFISGIFHKNRNVTQKIVMFVSLGFLSKIILYIMKMIVNGKASFSLLSDSYLPWYMFVMAMFTAVSWFLRNTDKRFVLVVAIILACVAGYDNNVGDYLYLSRFIVFYPFFVLGEMTTKETILQLNRNKTIKVIALGVIVLWLLICFTKLDSVYMLRPLFTGRNPFSINELFEKWGFLYRFICYIITFLTSFSILCLVPDINIPYISKMGARTLQVYFWHWPIALILKKIGLQSVLLETSHGKLLWLLIAVALTFLLSVEIFSFPTKAVAQFSKQKVSKKINSKEK